MMQTERHNSVFGAAVVGDEGAQDAAAAREAHLAQPAAPNTVFAESVSSETPTPAEQTEER